jgi:hypothetical protein
LFIAVSKREWWATMNFLVAYHGKFFPRKSFESSHWGILLNHLWYRSHKSTTSGLQTQVINIKPPYVFTQVRPHSANKPNFTMSYTTLCSTTFQSPQNLVRSTVDQFCHSRFNDNVTWNLQHHNYRYVN